MLSGSNRDWLLKELFARDEKLKECDFRRAEATLQGHIPESHSQHCVRRIVTISTSAPEKQGDLPEVQKTGSCPDAWIFDRDAFYYCLLVECKCRNNSVDRCQILYHTKNYFGNTLDWNWVERNWLPLTWYDVLEVIDKALLESPDARPTTAETAPQLNDQEKMVLTHLKVFLGYYGYRLFKGFHFSKLQRPPDWRLFHVTKEEK